MMTSEEYNDKPTGSNDGRDTPELKPCPFCGGAADIDHDHTVEESHAYGCRDCDLWFGTFNSDDAITAWNTRATDTRLADAEAMAEALHHLLSNYLQDEFDEPDLCVDEDHWLAISDARAALEAWEARK